MKTIIGEYSKTLVINKSTFISWIKHVESIEEARNYITTMKKTYSDATHVVSAYIIGEMGEYGHSNDDGEPSGTAGMPVFNCLKMNNLTNVVAIVIRYFGGIKLGAGGLIRAYSKATSDNINDLSLVEIIKYSRVHLTFTYPFLSEIEKVLANCLIVERTFQSNVSLIVKIPSDLLAIINQELKAVTLGTIEITLLAN